MEEVIRQNERPVCRPTSLPATLVIPVTCQAPQRSQTRFIILNLIHIYFPWIWRGYPIPIAILKIGTTDGAITVRPRQNRTALEDPSHELNLLLCGRPGPGTAGYGSSGSIQSMPRRCTFRVTERTLASVREGAAAHGSDHF
jgi:hypothetical protein